MTNWEKHFGTPELFVERLMTESRSCPLNRIRKLVYGTHVRCDSCKHYEGCFRAQDKTRAKYALEWLQEESEC